ncbi:dihydropyrimidinase [Ancylobacter amanitiformis]|uniref:Dihydropyrimidinase n=1 Tax=Ancylobacter amanitiformis TaxID=217069 RepID=A0ABU0LU74_9HYPH|nr:dihydropyrimidinase [Ancylobacter amanitiformis]MDQ0512262.1 dihydropyrimidinase [Ancylobacter amanitiformis]
MHERVITNGRVGLSDGWADCDIGIDGGRITALGEGLKGAEILDAAGLWVLPGGVDAHCHLDQPSWGGTEGADGFGTGSLAAVFGGTTTIVPFAMPAPGTTMPQAVERSLALAEGRSFADYSLHAIATEATGPAQDQMDWLCAQGIPSVKAFMTYEGFAVSDERMLELMDGARARGMTVMIHAENDAIIRHSRDKLLAAGRTALRYHLIAHSAAVEREAIHRVATLAEVTGARVLIVHISSAQGIEELTRARLRGTDVTGETCPQYVLVPPAALDGPAEDAARFLFCPPGREAASHAALWQALEAGDIALWSSDHSPGPLADKVAAEDFDKAVSGIPGLETRLPLLFSEGLASGRLSLPRYLSVAGAAAARYYGLEGKGAIAPGFDADLVLWDPAARWQVRAAEQRSRAGYTPFEGRWLTGRPLTVLLRGRTVVADGRLAERPPQGRFLPRRPLDPSTFRLPIEDTTPWLAA